MTPIVSGEQLKYQTGFGKGNFKALLFQLKTNNEDVVIYRRLKRKNMQTQTVRSASQTSVVVELLQNGFVSQTLKRAKHLVKDYEILNPKEVGEFIGNNVFLLDLLEEIPAQIRKRFGKKQKLRLQFVLDPEDPTWHRLHVFVPTKLDFKEAFATMERFDEEWWFDNGVRAKSKLMVCRSISNEF